MSPYDGFDDPRPEDEVEGDWQDSDDGDLPWDPNPPDKPQPWTPYDWRLGDMTPEERMFREMLEGDEDREDGS